MDTHPIDSVTPAPSNHFAANQNFLKDHKDALAGVAMMSTGDAGGAVGDNNLDGGGAPQGTGQAQASLFHSEAAPMATIGGAVSSMPAPRPLSVAAAAAPSAMLSPPETTAEPMGVGGTPMQPLPPAPIAGAGAAGNDVVRQLAAPSFGGMLSGHAVDAGIRGAGGAAGPTFHDNDISKEFAGVSLISSTAAMAGRGISVGGGLGFGGGVGSAGPASQSDGIAEDCSNVPSVCGGMGAAMGVSGVSAGGGLGFGGGVGIAGPAPRSDGIAKDHANAPSLFHPQAMGAAMGVSGVSAGGDIAETPAQLPPRFPCMVVGAARPVAESASAVAGLPVPAAHLGSACVPHWEGGGGADCSQHETPVAAVQQPVAEVAAAATAAPAAVLGVMARAAATAVPEEEVAGSASASTHATAASTAPVVAAAPVVVPATPAVTRAKASLAASFFMRTTRSQTAQARAESGGVDARSKGNGNKRARESQVWSHLIVCSCVFRCKETSVGAAAVLAARGGKVHVHGSHWSKYFQLSWLCASGALLLTRSACVSLHVQAIASCTRVCHLPVCPTTSTYLTANTVLVA